MPVISVFRHSGENRDPVLTCRMKFHQNYDLLRALRVLRGAKRDITTKDTKDFAACQNKDASLHNSPAS